MRIKFLHLLTLGAINLTLFMHTAAVTGIRHSCLPKDDEYLFKSELTPRMYAQYFKKKDRLHLLIDQL